MSTCLSDMLTQKDLNALYGKVKTNKYHNTKFTADGYTWDSQREYSRYCELKLLQRAGEIWALERQKEYTLIEKSIYGRKIVYRADFVYKTANGTVVEDVKSEATKTPLYKLKKRLLAERYGIEIKEIY